MSNLYSGSSTLRSLIRLILGKFNQKVDKVEGKQLSSNDFTDEYRFKLENLGDDATSGGGGAFEGVLPISQGGTGGSTAEEARSKLGVAASSHNHSTSDITSGYLPLSRGGTGGGVDLANAPANAIVRKLVNENYNQLYYTATNNGAFYATSENGLPKFGTLPVAQGGTGATSGGTTALSNLGLGWKKGTATFTNGACSTFSATGVTTSSYIFAMRNYYASGAGYADVSCAKCNTTGNIRMNSGNSGTNDDWTVMAMWTK